MLSSCWTPLLLTAAAAAHQPQASPEHHMQLPCLPLHHNVLQQLPPTPPLAAVALTHTPQHTVPLDTY